MNTTGLRLKLEDGIKEIISESLDRAFAAAWPDGGEQREMISRLVRDHVTAEATPDIALVAYNVLALPPSTIRVRATIEGDTIRTQKGAISVMLHCDDCDQNILDLRRMRGGAVDICATQLEFERTDKPAAKEKQMEIADVPAAESTGEDLATAESVDAFLGAMNGAAPESADDFPPDPTLAFDIIDPDGIVVEGCRCATRENAEAMIAEYARVQKSDPAKWRIEPVTMDAETPIAGALEPEPELEISGEVPGEMVMTPDGGWEEPPAESSSQDAPPAVPEVPEVAGFTEAQNAALESFRNGGSAKDAARAAGVSDTRIRVWMKDAEFNAAVVEASESFLARQAQE